MFRDHLWRRVVRRPRRDGMLCIACVERRLGRALHRDDFTRAPINTNQARVCAVLAQRLRTQSPHPSFLHDWRHRRLHVISPEMRKTAKLWRRK